MVTYTGFFMLLQEAPQIQLFNLIPGPGGPPEKLQAGRDTRIMGKASDLDDPPQLLPAMMLDQMGHYHFQRDTMQRVIIRIMNYDF